MVLKYFRGFTYTHTDVGLLKELPFMKKEPFRAVWIRRTLLRDGEAAQFIEKACGILERQHCTYSKWLFLRKVYILSHIASEKFLKAFAFRK